MKKYKKDFIGFLAECGALKFGEFNLKSGRISPYFINTGMFNSGKKIARLGKYYAEAIRDYFADEFDAVYGPAYKGIPLCVAAAIGLERLGINKGYVFNRKKLKDYGEKDNLIGAIKENASLILVDDVITSGAAIRESINVLNRFNISECRIFSDAWVFLNYFGKTTEPMPWDQLKKKKLDQGDFLISFYDFELQNFQDYQLYAKNFVLLGNISKCNKERIIYDTYLNSLSSTLNHVYNVTINTNPCFILFEDYSLLEKTCNFFNLKCFCNDANRKSWAK